VSVEWLRFPCWTGGRMTVPIAVSTSVAGESFASDVIRPSIDDNVLPYRRDADNTTACVGVCPQSLHCEYHGQSVVAELSKNCLRFLSTNSASARPGAGSGRA
jgi:hypothetical protein